MKWASTCICTYTGHQLLIPSHPCEVHTISKEPRRTPTSILENHSSSCARPSSGSSTKSARGFSSKMRENCLLSLDQFVIVGVMFRKILKPTFPVD